jgi:hypothetical protein
MKELFCHFQPFSAIAGGGKRHVLPSFNRTSYSQPPLIEELDHTSDVSGGS